MKELFKNKKFLAVFAAWSLLHTFLLLGHSDSEPKADFWPFGSTDIRVYDISEWIVYIAGPLVILFLIKSFTNDK